MPDDLKEKKAKKLAAARKKLKEYQSKEKRDLGVVTENQLARIEQHQQNVPSPATLSEKSCSDQNLNEIESTEAATQPPLLVEIPATSPSSTLVSEKTVPSLENEISQSAPPFKMESNKNEVKDTAFNIQSPQNINTIQLLICEKAALSSELSKVRTTCKEKELENEELYEQFTMTSKRMEDLQKLFVEQRRSVENYRNVNSDLEKQFVQIKSKCEDQAEHLDELKKQLSIEQSRNEELQYQVKDKSNELELTQIRINQLSDEANYSKDNRVETLTQTQFMYEQQIRDLQAMVQQLSEDKEQANQQYQNYVQHLNNEILTLTEKNSELLDECSKIHERERGFTEHISGLEREIQKTITRQAQLKEHNNHEGTTATEICESDQEIDQLREKLSEYEMEKHQFQLKIKSQEDRFEQQNAELIRKQREITELSEHIRNVSSDQPDKVKLLATMESDKVAASRALTQNEDLKKQLDELQLRFVQLTNDKAELTNRLDSEEHANREIRTNYTVMEEKLNNIDEKLHFKDEEMIRLSHENNDLKTQNLVLQQQLDRLQHYEAREYSEKYARLDNNVRIDKNNHNQDDEHDKSCNHDKHEHHDHDVGIDSCREANEYEHDKAQNNLGDNDDRHHNIPQALHKYENDKNEYNFLLSHNDSDLHGTPEHIPTAEAVEKLQNRFTQLMHQVANLTEEKLRLEHLVLQLQGETETIGEYVTLYQTQRRILKQREYEKAAQMQLLQLEREQLREKIYTLNKLVCSLGAMLPNSVRLNEDFNSNFDENVSIEPANNINASNCHESVDQRDRESSEVTSADAKINSQTVLSEIAHDKQLSSGESQEILTKIQNIIEEIKENTEETPTVKSVDHLNCCLGKFEIV